MGDGIWWDTYGDYGDDERCDYDNGRYSSEVPRRLDDRTVVAETQKAWQCSEGYWWPKSQSVRDKNGILYVSAWIWNQKMMGPVPEKPDIPEVEKTNEDDVYVWEITPSAEDIAYNEACSMRWHND